MGWLEDLWRWLKDVIDRIFGPFRAPPPPPKDVAAFYKKHLCPVIEFALAHGCELSKTDFFHCHVITDVNPKVRDKDGNLVLDEDFMIDHYVGLIGHAHEYDEKRSKTEDNFNVYRLDEKDVGFYGATHAVDSNDLKKPLPGSIYFRYCDPGDKCPPGVTQIKCGDKCICAALRPRWPEKDPALGP